MTEELNSSLIAARVGVMEHLLALLVCEHALSEKMTIEQMTTVAENMKRSYEKTGNTPEANDLFHGAVDHVFHLIVQQLRSRLERG